MQDFKTSFVATSLFSSWHWPCLRLWGREWSEMLARRVWQSWCRIIFANSLSTARHIGKANHQVPAEFWVIFFDEKQALPAACVGAICKCRGQAVCILLRPSHILLGFQLWRSFMDQILNVLNVSEFDSFLLDSRSWNSSLVSKVPPESQIRKHDRN